MSKEISLLDETLIRLAASGKSGQEMETITGIPGPQAVQHVKELMTQRDIWTEHQRRQLLLHELNELKNSLTEAAVTFKDNESARLLLKTLQEIGKRLDSQQVKLDDDMMKLTEYQQKVLLRAMDSALSFAKRQLAEKYPQVSPEELDELVSEGLVLAKHEIMEEGIS